MISDNMISDNMISDTYLFLFINYTGRQKFNFFFFKVNEVVFGRFCADQVCGLENIWYNIKFSSYTIFSQKYLKNLM